MAVDVAQMKTESLMRVVSPLSHHPGDGERLMAEALTRIEQTRGQVVAPMRPAEGAFFELNRVLYEVTRVSSSGKMLCKPFTGTLVVPRGTATATQIQGAKKA